MVMAKPVVCQKKVSLGNSQIMVFFVCFVSVNLAPWLEYHETNYSHKSDSASHLIYSLLVAVAENYWYAYKLVKLLTTICLFLYLNIRYH